VSTPHHRSAPLDVKPMRTAGKSFRLLTRAIAAGLACVLWCAASWVHAQESDGYKRTIEQALEEYERGNWDEAYSLFLRSHELSPSARTWRGIGVVAFELRLYVKSVFALDAALKDDRKPLTEEQREAAVRLITRARMFVATYHVTLRPESARLFVDDSPARFFDGVLLLDPGEHTLAVEADGHVGERRAQRAVAGTRIDLTFETPAPSVLPSTQRPPEARPASTHDRGRPWTWTLSATAVAAGAAGGVLALATRSEHEKFSACDLTVPDSTCSSGTKGQRLQLATNATLASAGVLAVAAITAFFLEQPSGRERNERATVVPTRDGLAIYGAF